MDQKRNNFSLNISMRDAFEGVLCVYLFDAQGDLVDNPPVEAGSVRFGHPLPTL